MDIELYDHQKELVIEARDAFRKHNHVLMQAATGFGKSICSAAIVKGSIGKRKRIWFVVPRKELFSQMSKVFTKYDIKHTFVATNLYYYDNYLASVCLIETLRRRMSKLGKPDFIIIDEAHFYGNGVADIVKFARENTNGDHVIKVLGLSATPARNDNMGMGDWFDVMVSGKSVRWLIDNGYLSDYKIIQPEIHRSDAITGDYIKLWEQYALNKLTVVFCKDVAHSERVAREFIAAGHGAASIDGTKTDDERRDIICDLATRGTPILTNNMLLTFGFDLALASGMDVTIEAMIDLAKTKSLPMQMQKWGRVLRRKDEPAVIIDCAGNSHPYMHGLPCQDRDWQLIKGNVRKRDLEVRERAIRSMHCKKCYRPSKFTGSPTCPWCGAEFEFDVKKIKIIDGKLIEITPEMIKEMNLKNQEIKKHAKMEVGKARSFDDLSRIAKERGYKSGWVYQMARFKGIKK